MDYLNNINQQLEMNLYFVSLTLQLSLLVFTVIVESTIPFKVAIIDSNNISSEKTLKIDATAVSCLAVRTKDPMQRIIVKIADNSITNGVPKIAISFPFNKAPSFFNDPYNRFLLTYQNVDSCSYHFRLTLKPIDNARKVFVLYYSTMVQVTLMAEKKLEGLKFQIQAHLEVSTTRIRPFLVQSLKCTVPPEMLAFSTIKHFKINIKDLDTTIVQVKSRMLSSGNEIELTFGERIPTVPYSVKCGNIIRRFGAEDDLTMRKRNDYKSRNKGAMLVAITLGILLFLIGLYMLTYHQLKTRSQNLVNSQTVRAEFTRLQLKEFAEKMKK